MTSGVGCLITEHHPLHGCDEGVEVPSDTILKDFFEELSGKVYKTLRRTFTDDQIEAMPIDIVQCLINIFFNLGSLHDFPSAKKAFQTQDWKRAALEMNYRNGLKPELGESDWCKQVHGRADRLIDRIEKHVR